MVRAVPDGEKNPKFEETFAEFKKYYGEHCLDHTKPYPDIMHLLTELKARGVKTAIVSNKLDSAVKELDERFFRGYMTTAIGEMEGVAKKTGTRYGTKSHENFKNGHEEGHLCRRFRGG